MITVKVYRSDHVGHVTINESDLAGWLADGYSLEPVKAEKSKKTKGPKAAKVDAGELADIDPAPGEAAEFTPGIDLE